MEWKERERAIQKGQQRTADISSAESRFGRSSCWMLLVCFMRGAAGRNPPAGAERQRKPVCRCSQARACLVSCTTERRLCLSASLIPEANSHAPCDKSFVGTVVNADAQSYGTVIGVMGPVCCYMPETIDLGLGNICQMRLHRGKEFV